jgi:1-acyl-sn-glycerol-3-phosphate acyltransferase
VNRAVRLVLLLLARVLAPADVRGVGDAPATRPRVYFANHASHLDFLVLWAALPPSQRRRTRPVAALDYWGGTRLRRALARAVGAVLVDRGAARPDAQRGPDAVRRMAAALDAGDSLVVFPAGTRAGGASPAPFKTGLYHLSAARPDVELVPVRIENTERVLPRGRLVPAPRRVRVTFGAPLRVRGGESKSEFLARACAAVDALTTAVSVSICTQKEGRSRGPRGIPAATYSPGRFPSEYHRRWRA